MFVSFTMNMGQSCLKIIRKKDKNAGSAGVHLDVLLPDVPTAG